MYVTVNFTVYYPNTETILYVGSSNITGSHTAEILNVPYIKQQPWLCSEASASMVLKYYGHNFSQEELNSLGCDRFENMLPFLSHYVPSKYASLGIEDLKKQIDNGNPAIIRIQLREYLHTVVVVGYDENYIYIHDPAVGPFMKATFSDLLAVWQPTDYKAIVFDR